MAVLSRRRLLSVTGAAGLVTIAACGADDDASSEGERRGEKVAVRHRFGTTTMTSTPRRIVAIDAQWVDVMLAMKARLVGYSVDPTFPDHRAPWQSLPSSAEYLDTSSGIPPEKVAALRPDLIVGNYSIKDKATYDQLSRIAPTIADIGSAQVSDWTEVLGAAGRVLSRSADASAVRSSVEDKIAQTATELPGLRGKTFALSQYVVDTSQLVIVADPDDGSSSFFRALGMRLYPPLVAQFRKSGQSRLQLSPERSDLLRADLLALLINGGDRSDLGSIPGFGSLPGTVTVLDYPTISGLNVPSPLSIPYALTRLRPALEKAGRAG